MAHTKYSNADVIQLITQLRSDIMAELQEILDEIDLVKQALADSEAREAAKDAALQAQNVALQGQAAALQNTIDSLKQDPTKLDAALVDLKAVVDALNAEAPQPVPAPDPAPADAPAPDAPPAA